MDIIQGLVQSGSTSGRPGLRIVNKNQTFEVVDDKTSNVIFTILNDGRVGAGTSVYSNLITNYVDTGSVGSGTSGGSGTTSNVISSQWTTSGTKIYYNDGNIGVGTIDPIAPLHIYNNAMTRLLLDATTTGTTAIEFRRGTGGDAQNDFRIINDTNSSLKLQCENTTQSFTDSTANIAWFSSNETILYKNTTMNGRVGIGTTYHATRALDVLGDANISGVMSVGSLSAGNVTITNSSSSNVSLVIQNNTPAVLITPATDYTTSITTEGTPSIIYQTNTFTFNQDNLVAYYKFNNSSSLGIDSNPSTTKYNLTPTGAPELISTATNFIEGSSVFLNANGEFLATAVNFPNTFGTSYSFWFKRVNNSTHDLLFAIGANFMVLAHMFNGFYLSNGMGGSETYAFASMNWVDNSWYHLVFIFTTTGYWKLYVNGIERTYTTSGGNYPFTAGNGKLPTGVLYIAGRNTAAWGQTDALDGYLDEFYVFNKELSQAEVTNLYNKTYSMPNNTWNINFPTSTAVIINNGASQNVSGNYTVSVSNNSSVIPAGGQSTTPYPSTAITTIAIKYANISSSVNLLRGTANDANHDYKVGNYNGEFKIISSVFSSSNTDTDYIKISTSGAITNPTGTASWNTGSDRRIKENIERASYDKCLDNINKLELNRFNYVSGFNTVNRDRTQLGFIAQEVKDIFPKAISSQEYYSNALCIPDLLSIDVSQINYSLYGAVKKLIEIQSEYDNHIETLDKRMKTLETILNIVVEPSVPTEPPVPPVPSVSTSNIVIEESSVSTSNIVVEEPPVSTEPSVSTSNIVVEEPPVSTEPSLPSVSTSNIVVEPPISTSNIVVEEPPVSTSNIVVEPPVSTSNIVVEEHSVSTSNIVVEEPSVPTEPSLPSVSTSNIVVEEPSVSTSNIVVEPPVSTSNIVMEPPVSTSNIVMEPPVSTSNIVVEEPSVPTEPSLPPVSTSNIVVEEPSVPTEPSLPSLPSLPSVPTVPSVPTEPYTSNLTTES